MKMFFLVFLVLHLFLITIIGGNEVLSNLTFGPTGGILGHAKEGRVVEGLDHVPYQGNQILTPNRSLPVPCLLFCLSYMTSRLAT